jgi:predicted PolB exonuclease-like 3'-5' exonuclease
MSKENNYLVLDIETIPQDNPNPYILEAYQKKWDKLDISKKEEQIQADKSLEIGLSKIFCICMKPAGESIISIQEDNEKNMLENFWNEMCNHTDKKLVTFNGIKFDVPYILNKSLIHKIPHFPLPMRRWDFTKHFDTRMWLTNWNDYGFGSMRVWCELMGIPFDKELADSMKVLEWFNAGMKELIVEHCNQDINMTEGLYLHIRECLDFN